MAGNCGKNDHCCWFKGEVCQYLVENPEGSEYKFACGLRQEKGDWEAVRISDEYQQNVKPRMQDLGYDIDCFEWPPSGRVCNTCGQVGSVEPV